MSGPFAEHGIVMTIETGSPVTCFQFDPGPTHLPPGVWLHRLDEFDPSTSLEAVVDEYALPEADTYSVRLIEVPPGEQLQIGDIAGTSDRSGGGNLVALQSRDRLPEAWLQEETTLEAMVDADN